jgi:hypothetical protein
MTLSQVSMGIKYKCPTAIFEIHIEQDGSIVVDKWNCADHPAKPSNAELQSWWDERYSSQDYIRPLFDVNVFLGRILQELSQERWITLSKLGIGWTIEKLIGFPNWDGLKGYLLSLNAEGTLSSDEITIFNNLFIEQRVDLGLV